MDSFRTHAVYIISVAAEMAGVHPQTLRLYEKKGLLEPGRSLGGARRYSEQDIKRLQRIQDLCNEGVNLEGVKRILALEEEISRLKKEIEALKTTFNAAIADTHKLYRRDLVPLRNDLVPYFKNKRR